MTLTHAKSTQENSSRSVAASTQVQSSEASTLEIEDNRPVAAVQRKLQEMADGSPQVSRLSSFQAMANNSPQAKQAAQLQAAADGRTLQKKEDNTGSPDKKLNGSVGNHLPVVQLLIDDKAFRESDLSSLPSTYWGYKSILSKFNSMRKGDRSVTPEDVLESVRAWTEGLSVTRKIAGSARLGSRYYKPLEEPFKSGCDEMVTELAVLQKALERLLTTKDISAEVQTPEWFFDHMTILPGLELSITAILNEQHSKEKREKFALAKVNFQRDCLTKRGIFLDTYTAQAIKFNETAEPDKILNTDPFYGLADLNVMHPHTEAEGQLIVGIDQLNSAFNFECRLS